VAARGGVEGDDSVGVDGLIVEGEPWAADELVNGEEVDVAVNVAGVDVPDPDATGEFLGMRSAGKIASIGSAPGCSRNSLTVRRKRRGQQLHREASLSQTDTSIQSELVPRCIEVCYQARGSDQGKFLLHNLHSHTAAFRCFVPTESIF
jgi:hypothetical protein